MLDFIPKSYIVPSSCCQSVHHSLAESLQSISPANLPLPPSQSVPPLVSPLIQSNLLPRTQTPLKSTLLADRLLQRIASSMRLAHSTLVPRYSSSKPPISPLSPRMTPLQMNSWKRKLSSMCWLWVQGTWPWREEMIMKKGLIERWQSTITGGWDYYLISCRAWEPLPRREEKGGSSPVYYPSSVPEGRVQR